MSLTPLQNNEGRTSTTIDYDPRSFNSGTHIQEAQFHVPNAKAAIAFQEKMTGRELGGYDPLKNSCMSHVCDVLHAGGNTKDYRSNEKMGHARFFKANKFIRNENGKSLLSEYEDNDFLLKNYKQGVAGFCSFHGNTVFWGGVSKRLSELIKAEGTSIKHQIFIIRMREFQRNKILDRVYFGLKYEVDCNKKYIEYDLVTKPEMAQEFEELEKKLCLHTKGCLSCLRDKTDLKSSSNYIEF